MQTSTGISTMQMVLNENQTAMSHRESLTAMMRKAEATDWDLLIVKIDKQISRAGAVVLSLSALYFISIFVSKLFHV
ncbi:MAG: hypothetical protein CVU71_07760 [Deltaproteobacteria bacterium HGW-Deltaproteobacteria-6]|jgi:hypothetical protein|nr:MAG: hypothetical protein CVU71_07760 [Deltaproteobacteria bacterium HGW-Deltaproteobacteria-6]